MALYGNTYELRIYRFGDNPPSLEEQGKHFLDSEHLKNVDLVWSSVTGAQPFKNEDYFLYFDKIFRNETAELFDSFSAQWQQITPFVYIGNTSNTTFPYDEAVKLFPNRIDISDYKNSIIYVVSSDESDVIPMLCLSDRLSWNTCYRNGSIAYYYGSPTMLNIITRIYPYDSLGNNLAFINDEYKSYWSLGGFNYSPSPGNGYWLAWSGTASLSSTHATWFSHTKKGFVPNTDPYKNGGSSTSAGGGGTYGGGNTIFGGASDSIDIPPLPTASASAAGFITLFNPTLGQLNNLANYMWSDLFSLETFKKIFADPMDCILGLSIVPVKPASAGTSAVKIGNISTDVSMNKTSSQYVAVDCGTIEVKEYWGAYLDYAPYTQCEIYLPYVGTKQISVDDVMNKSVHVVYHVDILSGACNAYVKCGDSVLYTFVGQCSSSIPISGNDWTNVLNGAISVAGKIGLAMATGGATALMSGLGAASSIISSSKPTVERSGAMSSTGGLLGIQKPYLILTRPKQALPENQNKYTGYPSFITMVLSECTGYTEIDSVHLENMSCTDEEAQEIENLLKSGVIF